MGAAPTSLRAPGDDRARLCELSGSLLVLDLLRLLGVSTRLDALFGVFGVVCWDVAGTLSSKDSSADRKAWAQSRIAVSVPNAQKTTGMRAAASPKIV